jgi:hypothetical protein
MNLINGIDVAALLPDLRDPTDRAAFLRKARILLDKCPYEVHWMISRDQFLAMLSIIDDATEE